VESEEAEGFHFYRLTRWGKTELLNETQAFRRVMDLWPRPVIARKVAA